MPQLHSTKWKPSINIPTPQLVFSGPLSTKRKSELVLTNPNDFVVNYKLKITQRDVYRFNSVAGTIKPNSTVSIGAYSLPLLNHTVATKHKVLVEVGIATSEKSSSENIVSLRVPIQFTNTDEPVPSIGLNSKNKKLKLPLLSNAQRYFFNGMSLVYLCSFLSLYQQIPGLYGSNGILPVRSQLRCDDDDVIKCAMFGERPTLLHLHRVVGLSASSCMELICLFGALISALQFLVGVMQTAPLYLMLWIMYFSCFQVGQTFLWFQWDTLLLEAGFLTVLVAPWFSPFTRRHTDVTLPMRFWLIRWLLFRLMFASGVVKLTSGCPTWWGLTALHWHWESQCIPTPLAWYFHHFPDWFKSLGVVATYLIEIALPLLFFVPLKALRYFAGMAQVFLMISIALTGNYNFFNFITAVFCASTLYDSSYSAVGTDSLFSFLPDALSRLFKWTVSLTIVAGIVYYTVNLFGLTVEGPSIQSKIMFNNDDLNRALAWWIPVLILMGSISLASEILSAVFRSFLDVHSGSKLFQLFRVVFFSIICLLMFVISLVPFSHLDQNSHNSLPAKVKELHDQSDKFALTHSYGLFRSMTGVGGRPEVILLGTQDQSATGGWKEFDFHYKPGRLSTRPPFVAPHQPRLDWQMWFAALGSYQHNPWLISLVYRLLHNETDVNLLLKNNPFGSRPPRFIKADLYLYHFTDPDSAESKKGDWWWSEYQREYMPPIDRNNPSVVNYLTDSGIIGHENDFSSSPIEKHVLGHLRGLSQSIDGGTFVISLVAVHLLFVFIVHRFRR